MFIAIINSFTYCTSKVILYKFWKRIEDKIAMKLSFIDICLYNKMRFKLIKKLKTTERGN